MLRRTTAALAGLATGFVVMASPAWAADPVVAGDGRGAYDTGIDQPGSGGNGPTTQPVGTGTGSGSGSGDGGGGGDDGPACTYTRAESMDKPGSPVEQAYYRICMEGDVAGGVSIIYVATAAAGVLPPSVTPEQLAQRIRNRMVLPTPTVGLNPDGEPYQLVQFPIWWWVSNWAPMTQRTELGPVWAEVTATPLKSRFDSGYGESRECGQPGIPWSQGLPESHPHSCQFTYRQASESFTAQITVTWRVTWVGSGGSGGTLPLMTMSTSQPMRVLERRTVVVDGRG